MNEGADGAIAGDEGEKGKNAEGRIGEEKCGTHTAHQPDEGPDREIEIVDGDDEHLRDGGKRDRHGILQHQVEAEIAHGPRLDDEGGGEHHRQRQEGQGLAQEPAVHAACSAKEACSTFSSVRSSAPRLAAIEPLRKT